MYWGYSLIIASWISTYHFAMQLKGKAFDRVKPFFMVTNFLVTAASVVMFVGLTRAQDGTTRRKVAVAGTIVFAAITFITGLMSSFYGRLITSQLSSSGGNTSLSPLARRMSQVTTLFTVCFIGESILWMVSILISEFNGVIADVIVGVYLLLDCVCIVAVMMLYRRAVDDQQRDNRKNRSDINASSTGGSHTTGRSKSSAAKMGSPAARRAAKSGIVSPTSSDEAPLVPAVLNSPTADVEMTRV